MSKHLTKGDVHFLAGVTTGDGALAAKQDSWATHADDHIDLAERLGRGVNEAALYDAVDVDDPDSLDEQRQDLREQNDAMRGTLRTRERNESIAKLADDRKETNKKYFPGQAWNG